MLPLPTFLCKLIIKFNWLFSPQDGAKCSQCGEVGGGAAQHRVCLSAEQVPISWIYLLSGCFLSTVSPLNCQSVRKFTCSPGTDLKEPTAGWIGSFLRQHWTWNVKRRLIHSNEVRRKQLLLFLSTISLHLIVIHLKMAPPRWLCDYYVNTWTDWTGGLFETLAVTHPLGGKLLTVKCTNLWTGHCDAGRHDTLA